MARHWQGPPFSFDDHAFAPSQDEGPPVVYDDGLTLIEGPHGLLDFDTDAAPFSNELAAVASPSFTPHNVSHIPQCVTLMVEEEEGMR